MILAKRLKGKAIAVWLGPAGDAARRAVAALQQRLDKTPKRLDVYLDASDPWSHLAAQAASRLADAYPVALAVHIVAPPTPDVDAHPAMRARHAVRDAALLAEYWDIEFAGTKEADPDALREVNAALLRERPAREQLRCAIELGNALWSGDAKAREASLGVWGQGAPGSVASRLASNYAELREAGHYQGGMLRYRGEWYWGIDRLPLLEAELARDFDRDVVRVLKPRPESARGPLALSRDPLTCELWFSFRSPYSYIALHKIEEALRPFDVPLVLRPIYPMVMRGISLPNVKRFYIVRDAKREADRQGVPFGEVCDPLGPGIENLLSLSYWANQQGKLVDFAKSATRGSWSEARDMLEPSDLRFVVERAGLSWPDAKRALGSQEASAWAKASAAELQALGLWGVPSIRCGDFIAWGQDRLPLLVDRLRRHRAAKLAATTP